VDDTPYGGGAGMVMSPEVWGNALDPLVTPGSVLIVPTPAGALFTQETATQLAQAEHLVFACGRYEGIDQRVVEHYSEDTAVMELSVGGLCPQRRRSSCTGDAGGPRAIDSRIYGQPESCPKRATEQACWNIPRSPNHATGGA